MRKYPYGRPSGGYSVWQTSDGGYIAAGWYGTTTTNVEDFYLVKTDPSGDTTWTVIYGGLGHDRLYCVQETSDGGYVATGAYHDWVDGRDSPDIGILKVDSLGNIEWFQAHGDPYAFDVGYYIIETEPGVYVTTGYAYRDTTGYGNYDTFLLKITSYGDTVFSTTYPHPNERECDWGHCVQKTTDGGYVIAGWTSTYMDDCQVRLIKTYPDTLSVAETKPISLLRGPQLQISPNPFKMNTKITFSYSRPDDTNPIKLRIYDVKGAIVKDFTSSNTTNIQFI